MALRKKMRFVGLGALVLGTTLGIGTATPAHADTAHHFKVTGSTRITDDEVFADEHCTRSIGTSDFTVSPGETVRFVDWDNGCGSEVRVEFFLTANLSGDGSQMCITEGRVDLYEGTSEWTDDLDGRLTLNGVCLFAGQTATYSSTVRNTAEKRSDDKASFTLEAAHFLAS